MIGTKGFALTVAGLLASIVGCDAPSAPDSAKPQASPDASLPAVLEPDNVQYFPPADEFKLAREAALREKPGTLPPVAKASTAGDRQLFVDWPKPDVAILITGEQLGYIEPCGCAGIENQKGGVARRYTLIKQLRSDGWPVLAVDLGGLINRFGQQAEIKFQTAVESLKIMDYAAVGFGPEDLRLPAGVLASCVASSDGQPSRFSAANVGLFALDSGLTSRWRVVEAGGRKFGIAAILSDDLQKEVKNGEIVMTSAEAALAEVVPKLKAESDYRILLSYAEPEETIRLAKKFPEFQVVVTAHGASEPPAEPLNIPETETLLIEVGHKGMFAVVLGLYGTNKQGDEKTPVRYQRVPIDARFADAPEMLALKRSYQQQLETLVKTQGWSALGAKPRSYPRAAGPDDPLGKFAGSEACGQCHEKAYKIWADTPHAHATETLVDLVPPRHFDPECISCHATGWNPQEFYPYVSGFLGLDETPHLKGNGCENCHGPGAAHADAEEGNDLAKLATLRQSMQVTRAVAQDKTCYACHDLDNSPEFDFKTYWPRVEHVGKD